MMQTMMTGKSIPSFGSDRSVFSFEDEVESLYLSEPLPQLQQDGLSQWAAPQQHHGAAIPYLFETSPSFGFDGHDSFDLPTVRPEEVTGQSLACKMEEDKREVLQNLLEIQDPSDDTQSLSSSVAGDAEMTEHDQRIDSAEFTDDLIRQMEDFISQYETGETTAVTTPAVAAATTAVVEDFHVSDLAKELLSPEQQRVLQSTDAPCPVEEGGLLTEEDTRVAEEILDDLLKQVDVGQPAESWVHSQATDLLQLAVETENLQDSGFLKKVPVTTVSNISQHPSAEGGKVVFVITPAATLETIADSPSSSHCDDDSDWTPETLTKDKADWKHLQRTPVLAGRVHKSSLTSVVSATDRKERKKLQNMEAARRYRDKKKLLRNLAQSEEAALAKKNASLKTQLHDLESEMKTMKKLMVELGILKVISD